MTAMDTPLSDTPQAPKLVPSFNLEPSEIVAFINEVSPELRQVVIESPDDGSTSHLVGPFADDEAAETWAADFITRFEYDDAFVRVSPLWELTPPDSTEIADFYGGA